MTTSPATLTPLQFAVMDAIAHQEHNPSNGHTPTDFASECPNCWFWAKELASECALSEQQLGGVITSLTEAGLIGVDIVSKAQHNKTGDDSSVWFTQAGWDAWIAARAFQAIQAAKFTTPPATTSDHGIQFIDSNPKREGTKSHARFEAYRHAKTTAEALALGATADDLKWDVAHALARLI